MEYIQKLRIKTAMIVYELEKSCESKSINQVRQKSI